MTRDPVSVLQDDVRSIEQLASAITSGCLWINLGARTLNHGSTLWIHAEELRHAGASAFVISKATSWGSYVHGGTVSFTRNGILLLSGHGVHFRGTTFAGIFRLSPAEMPSTCFSK